MNQEKIGKFILKLRKEKNLTQQELANKLGVTDKAISKWENGRGMPDLSLLKPLCDVFGISINDLLSGEISNEDVIIKDENIINVIDYSVNKHKKEVKKFRIIIFGIVLIVFMFLIDINRMRHNKPVIFSTWGYSYYPAIDISEDEIYLAIKEYLVNMGDNEISYHNGQKTFVSMRVYLLEERDNLYNVYAWVNSGKYYLENNEIKQDSCFSIPYKFIVKKEDNKFIVSDFRIPREGSYDEDMKNIFPTSVRLDMNGVYSDGTIERLDLDINEQLKLYFHK